MKRCFTSLVISNMQIKTVMIRHLSPTKMAIIKRIDNNQCLQGCRKTVSPIHCLNKSDTTILENVFSSFFEMLHVELLYYLVVSCLDIYPRELKTHCWELIPACHIITRVSAKGRWSLGGLKKGWATNVIICWNGWKSISLKPE